MRVASLSLLLFVATSLHAQGAEIPLPEHPRPDLERAEWVNLNGDWSFRFDKDGKGEERALVRARCGRVPAHDPRAVPVGLEAVGRPRRGRRSRGTRGPSEVPDGWKGKRVFLVVGASDWKTSGWLDGQHDRRAPGRLHAVRAGADDRREARPGPDGSCSRVGRHAPRVQARRQAGLRQGARPLADGVPRGARRRSAWTRSRSTPSLAEKRVELRSCGRGDPAPAGGGWRFHASPPRRRALPRSRRGRRFTAGSREARSRCRSTPARISTTSTLSLDDGFGRGPREDVLRLPRDRRREAARSLGHAYVSLNGEPLYLQLHPRPGLAPRRLLHLAERRGRCATEVLLARRLGLNGDPHAREGRAAAQALLGRSASACWSWPTCRTRGASPTPRCSRRWRRRCAA